MPHVTGPFVAIVTPFDAREAINVEALRRQVDRQARAGNGVFCAGTNGEFFALSFDEKVQVARICVEAAAGRVPVMAHIGEVSTRQTIVLGKAVQDLGIQAVSVVTPCFIPLSQEELVAYFTQVADALTVPVYLYNIPARTGNTITPGTAAKLADHPNIIGIKDSAGSQESLDGYLAVARGRDDFDVLVGPDSLIHHGLANGAAGCISGLANLVPETVNAIHTTAMAGDMEASARHQAHCGELRKTLYALGFAPPMVKRALSHAMPEVGQSRAPVVIAADVDAKIKEISARFVEAAG